ncbi:MAG: putative lipid II flippase FtsW [Pseudomonadota bacterium]|nr:putative lipid II flippase FtsW [Pseudomonadota bacterium]
MLQADYNRLNVINEDAFDVILISSIMLLVALGMTMVASTSMPISLDRFGYVYYFTSRHGINILVSLMVTIAAYNIPINQWQKYVPTLILLSFIALALVLLLGQVINGSKRWLSIGIIHLQVSEFIKVIFILYMADFFERKRPWQDGLMGYLPLFVIFLIYIVLLMLEPDFGSCFLLGVVMMSLLVVSPLKIRYLLALACVGLVLMALLIWLEPYRIDRLLSFIDPWKDRFGSGYQLVQSQMAMARGGWFGVGLGHSMQKLFYLPESHTDFIFAVLVEELGGITALVMIFLYALIITRLIFMSKKMYIQNHVFAGYIMLGWSQWIFLQVVINTGGTIGILPIKGLTLPFISYGGSSLVAHGLMLGIVLSALATSHTRNDV